MSRGRSVDVQQGMGECGALSRLSVFMSCIFDAPKFTGQPTWASQHRQRGQFIKSFFKTLFFIPSNHLFINASRPHQRSHRQREDDLRYVILIIINSDTRLKFIESPPISIVVTPKRCRKQHLKQSPQPTRIVYMNGLVTCFSRLFYTNRKRQYHLSQSIHDLYLAWPLSMMRAGR